MPLYTVTCTHPKKATDYLVDVTASTPQLAIQQLTQAGHITGAIRLADQPPATFARAGTEHIDPLSVEAATLANLHNLNATLCGIRDDLRRLNTAGVVRAPIGTVATAVLIALVIFGLLGGFTSYIVVRAAFEQQRVNAMNR